MKIYEEQESVNNHYINIKKYIFIQYKLKNEKNIKLFNSIFFNLRL